MARYFRTALKSALIFDTEANWYATNPILNPKDVGFCIDMQKFKVTDTPAPWNSIPYVDPGGGGSPDHFNINGGQANSTFDLTINAGGANG
jgi:hypothetical protein